LRIEHQNSEIDPDANDDVVLADDLFHFDDSDHIRYMNIIRDAHKTLESQGVGLFGGTNVTHSERQYGNSGVAYRPSKSISSFVAGFKSSVTNKINDSCINKRPSIWQTRFHDHGIRDHKEYRYIEHYIDSNIENWNEEH